MFSILAIDWGSRNIGLAFGSLDYEIIIPFAKKVSVRNFAQTLEQILQEKNIQKIVIGIPLGYQDKIQTNTHKSQDFAQNIKTKYPKIQVVTVSEYRSTQEVLELEGFDPEMIHNLSAVQILKNYLDDSF